MKLAEFYFELVDGTWWLDASQGLQLCAEGLSKFWQIPNWADRLWVQLHNRPAKGRRKISLLDKRRSGARLIKVDGKKVEVEREVYDHLETLSCKHKNLYAEVWFD